MRDRMVINRVSAALGSNVFPRDVDDAVVEICRGRIGAGIRPMQVQAELAGLIRLVNDHKPKTVLEIGTARGGTLCLLCRFASPEARIVSVDLPYARNGGGYPHWKEPYFYRFAQRRQRLHLLRADSHSAETIAEAGRLAGERGFDFILIDGDHSYGGVRHDFLSYRPMLAPGGLLALHDVLPNDSDPSIEVNRFWRELEADPLLATATIVADPAQRKCGIGLVYG
jgi:predicted O-methyltransferase YrrM